MEFQETHDDGQEEHEDGEEADVAEDVQEDVDIGCRQDWYDHHESFVVDYLTDSHVPLVDVAADVEGHRDYVDLALLEFADHLLEEFTDVREFGYYD